MAEEVVGFRDEIYAENRLLHHRSAENRKRCIALESKIEDLERENARLKSESQKTRDECGAKLSENEALLQAAITTIEAFKEQHRGDKQENLQLLKEINELRHNVAWLNNVLEETATQYERARAIVEKAKEDNGRLKEVNTRLVGELRLRSNE